MTCNCSGACRRPPYTCNGSVDIAAPRPPNPPAMKLYLAGPMRGIPEFNFPAFEKAAAALRDAGYEVFSPAERDVQRHGGVNIAKGNEAGDEELAARAHGFSLREAMADDTAWICRHADGVALLPGWQRSKGVQAERALALALNLSVYEVAALVHDFDPLGR